MISTVTLGAVEQAFSQGGNRLCFVDPGDNRRCIKVPRHDRTPEIKRAKKRGLAKLKPLTSFDDNHEEFLVFQRIARLVGDEAFELLPRCYGYFETEYGPGLCSELIRDDDGQISMSLKQYLWLYGYTDELKLVVEQFRQRWQVLAIPSRNLLLHNIVVQMVSEKISRLVVIDGLGWPDLIPFAYYCKSMARRKAARKASRLNGAIEKLLTIKATDGEWGYHGWLSDEKRQAGLTQQDRGSV
ncbi:MAG: YrbL family protein [Amphritea sp.]